MIRAPPGSRCFPLSFRALRSGPTALTSPSTTLRTPDRAPQPQGRQLCSASSTISSARLDSKLRRPRARPHCRHAHQHANVIPTPGPRSAPNLSTQLSRSPSASFAHAARVAAADTLQKPTAETAGGHHRYHHISTRIHGHHQLQPCSRGSMDVTFMIETFPAITTFQKRYDRSRSWHRIKKV